MKLKLYKRRQGLLALYNRGEICQAEIEKLAYADGVKPNTIWMDWAHRNHWIAELSYIRQTRTQLLQFLREIRDARETAWKICDKAQEQKNWAAAVGALRTVFNSIFKEAELRQSLGIMERVPEELDVKIVDEEKQRIRQIMEEMPEEELQHVLNNLKKFTPLEEVER